MTIEDLVSIRDIRSLAVTSDGQRIAYQIDQADSALNAYKSAWYMSSTVLSESPRFIDYAGPVNIHQVSYGNLHGNIQGWPAAWSPDGQWLAYLKKTHDGVQIWRASLDIGSPEQVTANAADVIDFAWSPEGSTIYYTVGRDRDFMANASAMEGRRGFLFDERINPQLGPTPLWSRCESKDIRFTNLSMIKVKRTCAPTAWVVDIALGQERRATELEENAYWELRQLDWLDEAREGLAVRSMKELQGETSVAWLENLDPESKDALAPLTVSMSRNSDRSNSQRCLDKSCTGSIRGLWWLNSTGEVIFRRSEGHQRSINSLYAWNPGDESVRKILQTDDYFDQCQEGAGSFLVCLYETWTSPKQVVTIDLESGSVNTIVDANPEFDSFKFTEIEKLTWSDSEGLEAVAQLVYPAGYEKDHRYPLVVVSYLCTTYSSFLRGGTGDEQPIHVMAQHGFAVLCFTRPFVPPKVRKRFADKGESLAAFFTLSPLPALEDIIDELDKREIIDPQNVGISGLSNGAILVEEAIVKTDRFEAASAAWSLSHPANYYLHNSSSLREVSRRIGGGEALFGGLKHWSEKSPGVHANKIRTALLLQVSDVEVFSALPNFVSLKDAGKPIEMYIFPDEYHIKWQPAHKHAVYKRNLQWFKFWLQGVEESDPLDPEQYNRWRTMRENHCANMKAGGESILPVYCKVVN